MFRIQLHFIASCEELISCREIIRTKLFSGFLEFESCGKWSENAERLWLVKVSGDLLSSFSGTF